MGTFVLISGQNNSGKSVFAEQVVSRFDTPRYYIATMIAQTPENQIRIQKHQQQRKDFNFKTLELPFQVSAAEILPNSTVLLEDASNLLANSFFEKGKTVESVFNDICQLSARCKMLVVVTISGLSCEGYSGETAEYIQALNTLNEKLFDRSDVSILMYDHIPQYQKGAPYDLA